MEEEKLNEEQVDQLNAGAGLSESMDYIAEQGRKVISVLTDAIDDLIKKN